MPQPLDQGDKKLIKEVKETAKQESHKAVKEGVKEAKEKVAGEEDRKI